MIFFEELALFHRQNPILQNLFIKVMVLVSHNSYFLKETPTWLFQGIWK